MLSVANEIEKIGSNRFIFGARCIYSSGLQDRNVYNFEQVLMQLNEYLTNFAKIYLMFIDGFLKFVYFPWYFLLKNCLVFKGNHTIYFMNVFAQAKQ